MMAANRVYIELVKAVHTLDNVTELQLKKLNEDNSELSSYFSEVTLLVKKELAKVKRIAKARRAAGLESLCQRLPNLIEGKVNSKCRRTRDTTIVIDKTIEINNGNDTLDSTITQTVKKSSRLAAKSCVKTRHQKDEEDSTILSVKKRTIEDEIGLLRSNCKRAKLKSDVGIENDLFKKPKPLRKGKKGEEKSVSELLNDKTITDEESFFNSNVLHSSPKPDAPAVFDSPKPSTSTAVVQVKTPSVKETVAAFERLGSEAGSSSTPRKNLVKNLLNKNDKNKINSTEKNKEVPSKEIDANNKTLTPESQEEDMIMDTDDESHRKSSKTKKGACKKSVTGRKSKSLFGTPDEKSPAKKENMNVTKTLQSKPEVNPTENPEAKLPSPEGKQENLNVTQTLSNKLPTPEGNLNATRTLRSKLPTPEGNEENLNVTRTLRANSQLESAQNLDKTQTIPVASKRTKPVLKSKIFDASGNNMLDCKVMVEPVETKKVDAVFAVPAPVTGPKPVPARRSNRQNSNSDAENCKSDSEVTKPRKRRSSELSEPEPQPATKAKKKSVDGKLKSNNANGEMEMPKKSSLSKIVKNEAIPPETSEMDVEPVPEPEPEAAARPKRTRGVRQVADMEVSLPKASKRTKPVKPKDDEIQDEPVRSTRTKTLKTAQMNTVEDNKLPAISVTKASRDSPDSTRKSDIENQSPVPVKKRTKMNKKKELDEENVIMPEEGGRITRTKSKAVKQQNVEDNQKQNSSVVMAKKSLNRAKIIALQKSQLEKLIPQVCITPEKGFNNYLSTAAKMKLLSTSKNQVLMNSTNKLQPVATPMSRVFNKLPQPISSTNKKPDHSSSGKSKFLYHPPASVGKDGSTRKLRGSTNSSIDSVAKSAIKIPKNDESEKELKLREKQEKEEEARLKKELNIKQRTEELKKKNELKIQMANKQREKLETEKHKNIIQAEKEKEEKRKLLLEEKRMKMKEEAMRKKVIIKQKMNAVEERRRLEEEARLAKIKEQEAEQQRIQLEKQKEIERNEKRAQERAAEKKARELFEQKQKEELAKEKAALAKKALQLQSANKQKNRMLLLAANRKDWNYKPRNENDYGLEDENSEVESGDEEPEKPEKPFPAWARAVFERKCTLLKSGQLEKMTTFITCYKKTPDIDRMFKMTPSKRIKRTSSAIWNTPSS